MGRPKQLIQINGTNLIRRTVLVAVATTPSRVLVVVGAHADDVFAAVADLAVEGVDCAEWEEGMAASLRAGFNALCDAEECAVAALRSAWSRRVASAGPSNRVAFESDERMCKCLWRHGRSPHAAAACLASGCAGIAWRLRRARAICCADGSTKSSRSTRHCWRTIWTRLRTSFEKPGQKGCVPPSVAMVTTPSCSRARHVLHLRSAVSPVAGFFGCISRYMSCISTQEGGVLSQESLLAARYWSHTVSSSRCPREWIVSPCNTGHSPRKSLFSLRTSGLSCRDTVDCSRENVLSWRHHPDVPRDTTFFLHTSGFSGCTDDVLRACVQTYDVHLDDLRARMRYLREITPTRAESLHSFGATTRDDDAIERARKEIHATRGTIHSELAVSA
jgi:hypothetical protein